MPTETNHFWSRADDVDNIFLEIGSRHAEFLVEHNNMVYFLTTYNAQRCFCIATRCLYLLYRACPVLLLALYFYPSGKDRSQKQLTGDVFFFFCFAEGVNKDQDSCISIFFQKMKIHSSCEIEHFVETHLCKLCVIVRSRALRVVCPD